MKFVPSNADRREKLAKGDGKLCSVGNICENSIKGICNIMLCKDFKSKVKGKGNPHDKNDNRLDF